LRERWWGSTGRRVPELTVEGDPLGRKITYPEDIEAFERRMMSS